MNINDRYLSLLEDTLLDNIYGSHNLLGNQSLVNQEHIINGSYWPLRAHTMIGKKRLRNIRYCFENIVADKIPGDLIETGVWRGGACILMKALIDVYESHDTWSRKLYVADSFQGLPNPDIRYPADANPSYVELRPLLAVSKVDVESNFKKYNLLDGKVIFLEGWFEHTLPSSIERLSILRLDGDMYSSTIQVLNSLYDKVSVGGYIIVDDYSIPACQQAVTEFRHIHSITESIMPIDNDGVWWRKER